MTDLPGPAQEIRDLRRERDEWRRECEKCSEKLAAAKEKMERLREGLIGVIRFTTDDEAAQLAADALNQTTTDPKET